MNLSLIAIQADGAAPGIAGGLPEVAAQVVEATVAHYNRTGHEAPWICYFALVEGGLVGTCGFKSPPVGGAVEIAYFTFPDFERRGYGQAMARELIEIARACDRSVVVTAQTLPERNASHRILEKLGFVHTEEIEHPEDGPVWEWRLIRTNDG